ncbi:hypothetical protein GTP23_12940 [Pseudoduganella sp. FT93W]|uniref:Enoyl-CoA hydratase/isomerase family protein n=1 Tax=Duganella fentianensis TaxID=2692177 RepID=A0A845HX33_9BURK|nr:enoyl-CoA hydratase/isomerase family protein [Duganella fentianensis]MYN45954.1 hypothetical protein [Duganella fentianensis]
MIKIEQQAQQLLVTLSSNSINPLSRSWQQALQGLLDSLELQASQGAHSLLVQISFDASKVDYQLAHLAALTRQQAPDCMQLLASYHALLRRLERLPMPVVAVLEGAVCGHAWGLALACQRRYALGSGSYSLPQATLGVAPCGGALVRTGRLLGLQAALPLLLDGRECDSATALQLGLLHGIAADAAALAGQLQHCRQAGALRQPWDVALPALPGGAIGSPANLAFLQLAPARLRARHAAPAPAEQAILCALAEGMLVDFDTAVLIESRYFCQSAIAYQA